MHSNPATDTTTLPARRNVKRIAMAAAALALVGALGACGSDSDTTSSASAKTSGSRNASAAVCDNQVQLNGLLGQAPNDPAQIKEFAKTQVLPTVDKLVAALPTDLGAAGADLSAGYKTIADAGDPSALESPKMSAAQAAIGEFVHGNCKLDAIDVTALDYSYVGIPDQIKAGRTSFKMVNKGKEPHEIVILRRNDGVSDSFEDLSKLPQDQMMSKVSFSGVAFGGPGSTTFAAVDLKPGTYFLVCNMPKGGQPDGQPHFMLGMERTITVA
jgi:hypothetical protein